MKKKDFILRYIESASEEELFRISNYRMGQEVGSAIVARNDELKKQQEDLWAAREEQEDLLQEAISRYEDGSSEEEEDAIKSIEEIALKLIPTASLNEIEDLLDGTAGRISVTIRESANQRLAELKDMNNRQ